MIWLIYELYTQIIRIIFMNKSLKRIYFLQYYRL